MNALLAIRRLAQSIWRAFISRQVPTNGGLTRRIDETPASAEAQAALQRMLRPAFVNPD